MEIFTDELHSSASSEFYPQNSTAPFTNFLPNQINLDGKWEMVPNEIIWPRIWLISRKVDFELVCPREEKFLHQKNTKLLVATT